MIEKKDIKKALLQALYVIVVCYILLNVFIAYICFDLTDSWTYEDAEGFPIAGGFLLVYSAILNFVTALVTKRFNRIISKIHKIMAVVCIVSLVVVMIIE